MSSFENTSSVGNDEQISGSKIEPLDSTTKSGVSLDSGAGGVVGREADIEQSRVDPVGGRGQYQNPAAHADSQGVVGRDQTIQESKIEPLSGPLAAESGSGGRGGTYKGDVGDTTGARTTDTNIGVDDETVDASRIDPLGSVREEMKP